MNSRYFLRKIYSLPGCHTFVRALLTHPHPKLPTPTQNNSEVETTKFVQHCHRLASSQDFGVSGKMGLSENKGCLALPNMFPKQTRRETSLKTDKIPDWVVALSVKKVVQNCQKQQPAPNMLKATNTS